MNNYLDNTYKNILQSIKDNYNINDVSDYNVYDATFLSEQFKHIRFTDKSLVLGVYRVTVNAMGFYSAPYLHTREVEDVYNPKLKRIHKSFFQIFKSSKPKNREYKPSYGYNINLLIEKAIPEDIAKYIPSPISNSILDYFEGDGIWDIFLLDNLKYILPAFGPGIYIHRHFITRKEDVMRLPEGIIELIPKLHIDILPQVIYQKSQVTLRICYFNKWVGLVRLYSSYAIDLGNKSNVIVYKPESFIKEKQILIRYDCGTRY